MSKDLATTDVPMPVVYTRAVKALEICCNLDEAKAFTDGAEALAVWAKIYKKNEAGRQAKQLKLHAHRRMGQLAIELAPNRGRKGHDGGRAPGPIAMLRSHGLTRHQADAAHHLAKIGSEDFDTIVEQDVPPAPTTVARRLRKIDKLSPWKALVGRPRTPFGCSTYIANNSPAEVARMLTDDDAHLAAQKADALIKWLQDFRRALAGGRA